jgi:hypothetical protein
MIGVASRHFWGISARVVLGAAVVTICPQFGESRSPFLRPAMKTVYEIKEDPTDVLGGASGDKRHFSVRFLGKTNNELFPLTVANEMVATQIGISLGLNAPTVLAYRTEAKEDFALIQWCDMVPASAKVISQYAQTNVEEIHGCIMFDLFVANNDRAFSPERRNVGLYADNRLLIFDQGNACYYRNRPARKIEAGIPRLNSVEADLAAMFDMSHKQNVYFQMLTDWKLVERWAEKIQALPDFLLESAVKRVPDHCERPTSQERERLVGFLIKRKRYLFDHIVKSQQLFPGLPKRVSNA